MKSKGDDANGYQEIQENPIVLDFSKCRYLGEMHKVLKEGLGLPDYYGENWDALWDCLRSFRPYDLTIEIHGLDRIPIKLLSEINHMLGVFKDVSEEAPNIHFTIAS